jgi:hypothetical protein
MIPSVVTETQKFITEMKARGGEPFYATATFSKLTLRLVSLLAALFVSVFNNYLFEG